MKQFFVVMGALASVLAATESVMAMSGAPKASHEWSPVGEQPSQYGDIVPFKLTTFDAQTRAELQEWARLVWEWYDTGVVPPEAETFSFTDPDQFPRWFHPFNPALTVFRDIYRHRLPDDEYGFTIVDLIEQDPAILAHFREYTVTGILETPFDEDAQAATNHIERLMQAEAGTSNEYALLGSWGHALYIGDLGRSGYQKENPEPTRAKSRRHAATRLSRRSLGRVG